MSFTPELCTPAFGFQDGFQTTLSDAMSDSATTAPLTSLPTPTEGTIVIEPGTDNEEEIYYTSKGTGVLNIAERGVNGTAKAHNSGVAVKMLATKASFDAITPRDYKGIGAVTCGTDNVIAVPAAYAAIAAIGDKLAIVDDGVQIYGYVVGISSSNITGVWGTADGSAHTLASGSTITSAKFSKGNAVGFPSFGLTLTSNLGTQVLTMNGGEATIRGLFTTSGDTSNSNNGWYSTTDQSVTFGIAFTAAPIVSATTVSDHAVASITSISTTTLILKARSVQNIASTAQISWAAIGKI